MGTGIYEILAYKILNSIVMVIIKMRNKQMLNMAIACKMTVNNLMQPLGCVITTPHRIIGTGQRP